MSYPLSMQRMIAKPPIAARTIGAQVLKRSTLWALPTLRFIKVYILRGADR